MMTTHATPPANVKKTAQLQEAIVELLTQSLQRGFFGTAGVEWSIQDGTIQHIRRKVDRIEK